MEYPIWDKLQQGMEYTIVFRNCGVILPSQAELEDCPVHHIPPAVHVPMNPDRRGLCRGSTTGITALALPMHFVTLGAHACDSCRLLKNKRPLQQPG